MWLSSAQRCKYFSAGGSFLCAPDKRGMGKGVPREAMRSAQGHKAGQQQRQEPRTDPASPHKTPRLWGNLCSLWCKGRGRRNDMDLSLRCYAGRHNSLLPSPLLFNLNAPLTLFFVWNVIYVSVYKSAMYK